MKISDFGGLPDGSDTTPALNAALVAAASGSDNTITFDVGDYDFVTPPDAIYGPVRIVGRGQMATVLRRKYQGSQSTSCGYGGLPVDKTCDFIVIRYKGVFLENLTILADIGTRGGTGLHIVADASTPGGYHVIRNVWITGGASPRSGIPDGNGLYLIPLLAEAANRGSGFPLPGLRVVFFENVTVWNGTWWAVDLFNCVACEWFGGGVYQGNGTTQSVVVTGTVSQRNYLNANFPGGVTGSGYVLGR